MGVPTHAMDILGEMRRRGLDRLGAVTTFYMAGSPIPREVAQAFLDRGVTPQNVYGMSENSSHQYTLPDDDPRDHRRDLRPGLPRLRDPAVGPGEPRHRGGAGRDRRDRRPRRLPDARLFRQPGGDRGVVQPRRLVHVGRSRPVRREGLPRDRRPQEGPDHPRRPQHPPGEDRGPGDASPGGGALCRFCGRRPAARREGVPVGDLSRRRRGRAWRAAGPPARSRAVALRHAGVFHRDDGLSADRQRQDPEARTRRMGEIRPHQAGAGALDRPGDRAAEGG